MTSENFINLEQAVESTGLSQKTLERFSNSGLIQSQEFDGIIKFSKMDLQKTFGIIFDGDTEASQVSDSSNKDQPLTNKVEVIGKSNSSTPKSFSRPQQPARAEHLQKALTLHERLLEEKDSQLNEKTNEIQWLRQRIEKLEDQSEKDKVLLLNSNNTLNQLIVDKTRKSVFQRLIGWTK